MLTDAQWNGLNDAIQFVEQDTYLGRPINELEYAWFVENAVFYDTYEEVFNALIAL